MRFRISAPFPVAVIVAATISGIGRAQTVPDPSSPRARALKTAQPERVDIDWSTTGRFEQHVAIQHARAVEACADLVRGDRVNWRFDAPKPLVLRIVATDRRGIHERARAKAMRSANNVMRVDRPGAYCWRWTSPEDGVDVSWVFKRSVAGH